MSEILNALARVTYPVILSLHPRTKKAIKSHRLEKLLDTSNIVCIEPPGFWDTQSWIKNAVFVITDSGGIIKETYFYKVPGIIIDKQTEWIETVDEGWNIITGPNTDKILEAINIFKIPTRHSNCIGNGSAGPMIVHEILKYLDARK